MKQKGYANNLRTIKSFMRREAKLTADNMATHGWEGPKRKGELELTLEAREEPSEHREGERAFLSGVKAWRVMAPGY